MHSGHRPCIEIRLWACPILVESEREVFLKHKFDEIFMKSFSERRSLTQQGSVAAGGSHGGR